MFRLLVFDFDGTLADTEKLYVGITCQALKKCGYYKTKKQIRALAGPPLKEVLHCIGVEERDIGKITATVNNSVIERAGIIKLCVAAETIKKLSEKRRLAIVSNSHIELIERFLEKQELRKYFSAVCGCQHFKRSKSEAVKMLAKRYGANPEETLYIADRAEDVDVAREAGCKSLIVRNKYSWGSGKDVTRKHPDFLVKSLDGKAAEMII
jgi:phosphoglycolate phosphatase-like HAD superfamily hydrolase